MCRTSPSFAPSFQAPVRYEGLGDASAGPAEDDSLALASSL